MQVRAPEPAALISVGEMRSLDEGGVMTEKETARAIELARELIERLRIIERARDATGRTPSATELREILADTLRHAERAMRRRHRAERRLREPLDGATEVRDLQASLERAEQKVHDAGQLLSVAVQRTSDRIASWNAVMSQRESRE